MVLFLALKIISFKIIGSEESMENKRFNDGDINFWLFIVYYYYKFVLITEIKII